MASAASPVASPVVSPVSPPPAGAHTPLTHSPSLAELVAQSPVSPHSPTLQDNNVEAILARKAEVAKNKQKFALTEQDATLILTHSTELHLNDGDVIMRENEPFNAVYRVKSGKIAFTRHGIQFYEITKGWFIGDTLLLTDKTHKKALTTMTARGPVVLAQLNLPFVRHLFSVDIGLSLKFMRHLASKLASLFFQILANLKHPSLHPNPTPEQAAGTSQISFLDQRVWNNKPSRVHSLKRQSGSQHNIIFKVYELSSAGHHGVHSLVVKPKKIKVVHKAFGLHMKTRVLLDKLQSITKLENFGITLIHRPMKATTFFFKNAEDQEEFLGYVTSILPCDGTCPNSAKAADAPVEIEPEDDVYHMSAEDAELYKSINTEEVHKKGDILFEEGDLFQRVYTLVSGVINVKQSGYVVNQLHDGDIFGVGSLLILRPSVVTMEVASETALVQVMPLYKMRQLMETHVRVANRILINAAEILEHQNTKVLATLDLLWDADKAKQGEQMRQALLEKAREEGL